MGLSLPISPFALTPIPGCQRVVSLSPPSTANHFKAHL